MMSRAKAAMAMFLGLTAASLASVSPSLAGPVLLFEADSGRVLYAEDQDHQWYPASLTKIMTAYLAFDALKSGRLKLDDTVTVTEKAFVQEPSKLGLPVGTEISVDLAIRALVVKSANDVAIMLAEKIGGSEEDFVRLMNDTARRLGMTRTQFANANGLPIPGQMTTARDLARLSRAVLRDFPEQSALWALPEVRIGKMRLRSHNTLLRTFEGADGLKTGFICDSGFNVVASATRDNRHLIAIVLGEPSGRDRNLRAAGLLDHGFETAAWKDYFGAVTVDSLPVDPQAKELASVRSTVVAWDCGNRKVSRKAVRRKPPASATRKPARGTKAAEATGITETSSSEASPPPQSAPRTPKSAAAPSPAPRRAAP